MGFWDSDEDKKKKHAIERGITGESKLKQAMRKVQENTDASNSKEGMSKGEKDQARNKRFVDGLTPKQKAEREKKIANQRKPKQYKEGGIVSKCEKFPKLMIILKGKKKK